MSGAVATAISIPAYYITEDVFGRAVYAIGQTLGVAGIGYGSYLVLLENDYTRFKRTIDLTTSLSDAEKNSLAKTFLEENAERGRRVRRIRVITHGLTAVLNISNAVTATQRELRTALFFVGGINVLAALSFGFGQSEEEKLFETQVTVGPTSSVQLAMRF